MILRRFPSMTTATFVAMLALVASASPHAQGTQPAPPPKPAVPLKIEVVISRFQADKKVGSAPFTLWVNAVDPKTRPQYVSVRMGMDVPVGTRSETRNGPNNSVGTTTQGPDYRQVGTSIDCMAFLTEDGRFAVEVRVQDTSIYTGGDDRAPLKLTDPLAFRSFTMNNTLNLRPGQTAEYSMSTDRITGEVVKVEVTVNVVK